MTLPDEKLMAYADGELDANERAEVEAAMAADPELAQRVAKHKALRRNLSAAFEGVLREPVPDRLLEAVKGPRAASVTDLNSARAARTGKPQRRWSWPEWGSIAASLVVGVIVGRMLLFSDAAPMTVSEGRLLARSTLAQALSTQLASEAEAGEAVRVGLSFRDRAGSYCRTFMLQDGSALAGLACRGSEGWNVDVLARTAVGPSGDYSTASSALPDAVRQAVEARMAGEPLDADDEAKARSRDWQD